MCSELTVKVWGIHVIRPEEEKEGCGGKDLQKRNVLSLEWKSEWVMEYCVKVSRLYKILQLNALHNCRQHL